MNDSKGEAERHYRDFAAELFERWDDESLDNLLATGRHHGRKLAEHLKHTDDQILAIIDRAYETFLCATATHSLPDLIRKIEADKVQIRGDVSLFCATLRSFDPKIKDSSASRYSDCCLFALEHRVAPEEFLNFVAEHGGRHRCAKAYQKLLEKRGIRRPSSRRKSAGGVLKVLEAPLGDWSDGPDPDPSDPETFLGTFDVLLTREAAKDLFRLSQSGYTGRVYLSARIKSNLLHVRSVKRRRQVA